MAGNVSEWTSSQYCDSYGDGKKCTEARVFRGGSWYCDEAHSMMRSSYRFWDDPGYRSAYLGFRCARSASL